MKAIFVNLESREIACQARNALASALRSYSVTDVNEAIILLGCSRSSFRRYITMKFQEGMTWKNRERNGWHLDHIIPLAAFDLTDPVQLKKAFYYKNYQPLWASDNLSKSSVLVVDKGT